MELGLCVSAFVIGSTEIDSIDIPVAQSESAAEKRVTSTLTLTWVSEGWDGRPPPPRQRRDSLRAGPAQPKLTFRRAGVTEGW